MAVGYYDYLAHLRCYNLYIIIKTKHCLGSTNQYQVHQYKQLYWVALLSQCDIHRWTEPTKIILSVDAHIINHLNFLLLNNYNLK
jgi:hypothetical protein